VGGHKKHFILLLDLQFFVALSSGSHTKDFSPGLSEFSGSSLAFPLQDLVRDCATQHVAGDIPGESVEGPENETRDGNHNGV
jgi:hypothetical protein